VDQKFKFAVLNLKHSGRPEDKAKNAVFKKELVDFAQAMNNGTSEETLIADANKIIGQINGYNSNLKLQGLTTMDELFDFNEGLSVTWRSYDRQFNGGKNVNSRSTSIYSDIKQQQSKVVSRVSKEKNSE